VWSRTGVGTQMQTTSASARAWPPVAKASRPVATPRAKAPSSTPGTHSSPAASAATRAGSVSIPVTANPASAATQASDSPT
jgi:hypothetical protein